MLPNIHDYEQLYGEFRWPKLARYNIGVDVCDRWDAQDPNRLAILNVRADGKTEDITFGWLRETSNRLANTLAAHGVARGERVALRLPQAPEAAAGHIAIYKMGAIAVPLAILFGVDALTYRLQNAGVKAVITNAQGLAKLAEARASLPELSLVLSIDGPGEGALGLHGTTARASGRCAPAGTPPDDPALMIFTSGTTGQAKGALHAHRVLLGHMPGVEMPHEFFPQPGDRFRTPSDCAWAWRSSHASSRSSTRRKPSHCWRGPACATRSSRRPRCACCAPRQARAG